jgi:hypothetical protein
MVKLHRPPGFDRRADASSRLIGIYGGILRFARHEVLQDMKFCKTSSFARQGQPELDPEDDN